MKKPDLRCPVSKAFMPPLESVYGRLEGIWDSAIVTNNGPLVQELELQLADYFGVKHVFLCSSGTTALQIAVMAMQLQGEVITSPFSYVSAVYSLVLGNCKPVYTDIESVSMGMDPSLIEGAITKNTSAILPTHLYGNANDVHAIQTIADKHGLKVLYDAAHSFGSAYDGKTLLQYGDVSVISFHAFKIFHCIEGGAVITNDDDIAERVYETRYFGIDRNLDFVRLGLNGKNSELHAAIGLENLKHIDRILESRREIYSWYHQGLDGSGISYPKPDSHTLSNHAYVPVIFENEAKVNEVMAWLARHGIQTKRYFYPSLDELDYLTSSEPMKVSRDISSRLLILPSWYGLEKSMVDEICDLIHKVL